MNMVEPETCPKCQADLRAGEIPKKDRHLFGGATRFLRVVAIYDRNVDRTVAWQCPDCNHRWERE